MTSEHDTIAAPATAAGGALAVVRISGTEALTVCDRIFRGRVRLTDAAPNSVHYGRIVEPETGYSRPEENLSAHSANGEDERSAGSSRKTECRDTMQGNGSVRPERTVDDVLVSVFRAPHSYTGEDSVEISCHGSSYIVSELLRLLIASGARTARPGEFTTRAFLAGKMDLAQAEAVADLIASSTRTAHTLASAQMRGGISAALDALRIRLVELMSLLELELDFSEEDVEFADRSELSDTMQKIDAEVEMLRASFSLGNALKQGVAVAIVGAPNVGKSTLLNRLIGEDRAMVSEIAGTTRDVIEETMVIDGVMFRFIDTAGLRITDDRLEQMGIDRTHAAIARAQIVIRMTDAQTAQDVTDAFMSDTPRNPRSETEKTEPEEIRMAACEDRSEIAAESGSRSVHSDRTIFSGSTLQNIRHTRTLHVVNKIDKVPDTYLPEGAIAISAREGIGIDRLRQALRMAVNTERLYHGDTVVSNTRHYEALTSAHTALARAIAGIGNSLPSDLLGEELRNVLYHLGTITGEITSDEILNNIFSKFCVGK